MIHSAAGNGAVINSDKPPIIEIHGLTKRYGGVTAVKSVDLAVREGEIFGILGPNGAGKTTTLEMIEGLRTPDDGTITVDGIDAIGRSDQVRRIIGVQLQSTALFDYLNAAELIELFAGLYGVDGSATRVDELLSMVDLTEKRHARVDELSGGQRQRLSITLALVNQPRVVFLDEPTTGLDPGARRGLWQTIRGVRTAGTTVVLTTHYMEEADVLCDRVAIMDGGEIIACDTPTALVRALGEAATISARVANGGLTAEALTTLPGSIGHEMNGEQIALRTSDVQATLVGLLALAERTGIALTDLNARQSSLEDVFLSLTGRTYQTASDAANPEQVEPAPGRRRRRA